ncbi:glycine cleavage system aminomethyltransferase GcvT [Leptolyngbya sp. FACHB-261]|uniref:glycine cleavage system aminomethyltransferase GcvT n=1 Tax=Leptolyngbya sp. FACHB-261 TaxID=2692806 RepID=UPI001684B1E0|nr:glycine cleavage system aminomethyltransferase GcvT [Leptolyngbya sp. FACHB-261]MBD2102267.1 glycine cleavage system aminomethyltransferase GcvT [Leptolyngbya sp. FACHB-261]
MAEVGGLLRRTPLFDLQQQAGARMVAFGGWEMPVQYVGIQAEHQAVRQGVGVFDISHMGKFALQGSGLVAQLQQLVPSNLARLQPGQAQYTVLLNPQGGIIDDLIFYNQGGDRWLTIVNASTSEKDRTWLLQHLDLSGVAFEDRSAEQVLLAVQGPEAVALVQSFVPTDLSSLPRFGHLQSQILGAPAFLARTGYTGEDGFEIMLDVATGVAFWQRLLAAGAVPCGLGARDTLRLEAAMHLYGQDMSELTTPLEASLGWLVHWDQKPEFIGRTALETQKSQGVLRRLVGLEMTERAIARHGYPLVHNGQIVGEVTSGTLSPTLGKPIAMGYVSAELASVGQELGVEIRGRVQPARVVKRPFYKAAVR